MQIEMLKIEEVKSYQNNPRDITAAAIEGVAASIKQFGFKVPIIVDKDNILVAGHTRVLAAKRLGLEAVPAIKADDLTEAQIRAFRICDNKVHELSTWDYELLPIELRDLQNMDFDLQLLGFDSDELAKILDPGIKDGLTDPDDVPEPPVEPITKPGDLWILGDHRLLCGDSTNPDDVAYLMNSDKASLIFTDPPYNCNYGSSKNPKHKIRQIENDSMSTDEWSIFCHKMYEIFKEFNTGDIYMWGASGPEGMRMRLWLVEMGCHWSATIIWKKQQLVLTPANYQRMYEPCYYGWFGKSSFGDDRTQTEVWEINRPLNSKLHPTMKPVELCIKGITNSSVAGAIVFDGFLGSGSTLIACEQTGRKCYGVEIDPAYCDVIKNRWEQFTGKKAVLANEKTPAEARVEEEVK
ncbi:MAG: Modification methylase DpnIIB [Planctomycetes bacterium ADurb.Bin401]|nr:MAG: Modification methylase DpnIIB [Planctomycetes bacterium ADurb.Bin401]